MAVEELITEYVELYQNFFNIGEMRKPYEDQIDALRIEQREQQKIIGEARAKIEDIEYKISQIRQEISSAGIPDTVPIYHDIRKMEKAIKKAGRPRKQQTVREFSSLRNRLYAQLVERDGEKCGYCESTHRLQVDHITPVSCGGGNEIDNLQLLCSRCNMAKRDEIYYLVLHLTGRKPHWDWIKK